MKTLIPSFEIRHVAVFALAFALVGLFATGAAADQAVTPDATQATALELPAESGATELPLDLDPTASAQEKQGGDLCIQVITWGKNPGTGECEQFATPCDVPNGWQTFSTLEDCQAAG